MRMMKQISTNTKMIVSDSQVMAVFLLLIAFGRCFFYSSSQVFPLVAIGMMLLLMVYGGVHFYKIDIIAIFIPIIAVLHKSDGYPYTQCLFVILAWLAFLYFRRNTSWVNPLFGLTVGFVLLNNFASILNIVSPETYFKIIDVLLIPNLADEAKLNYNLYGHITGLADHYSRNAYFCVAGGCVFAAQYFAKEKTKVRFGLLVFELGMIMLIGKRGHFLFFLAALLLLYVFLDNKKSNRRKRLVGIAIMVCVVLGIVIAVIPTENLFHDINDISTGRFFLWERAIQIFNENPILGAGYGYFSTAVYNDTINAYFSGVHNDYLQWLCEIGIVGFAVNFTTLVLGLIVAYKVFRWILMNDNCELSDRVAIIWSLLFQMLVVLYSLTGLPHYDYEINIVYFIALAVPYALARKYGIQIETVHFKI